MLEGLWWVSYGALWIIALLEAAMLVALARQIGVLHTRVGGTGARMTNTGLEVGNVAPAFRERDLQGREVTLGVERNKPTLLIFLSPNCHLCGELAPAVRTLHRFEKREVEIVLISLAADDAENRAYVRKHRLEAVPYLVSPKLAYDYHVASAPYGILVDAQGKVYTKGLSNNLEHLESLLNAVDEGFDSFDTKMNSLVTLEGRAD